MSRSRAFLAAACLLLPALLSAHAPPIGMTRVTLKADGDALRVRVEVTALPWMVEVSGKVDEEVWPEDKRRISEDYLKKRLVLAVDGKALDGRLLQARYVREPWMSDFSALFVFDLLYPLPSTGTAFTVRNQIFLENWEENEGAAPGNAPMPDRDFRTRIRWSSSPGKGVTTSIQSPAFSLPLGSLRRAGWEPFLESASLGFSSFLGLGGAVALLLAAALFPPSAAAARAGLVAAGASALLGAALPAPLGERVLWAAVALMGLTSLPRLRVPVWIAGLALGAAAAAHLLVLEGAAVRDATAFSFFSRAAFGAGVSAPLLLAEPFRRAAAFLHRKSFRYLSDQEYARQALFHRNLISRFLAVAGLYWVLSPLWSGPA